MGSQSYPSSDAEDGCKSLFFVSGCAVIVACVCLVAVVPLRNNLCVLRGTVNACVCGG